MVVKTDFSPQISMLHIWILYNGEGHDSAHLFICQITIFMKQKQKRPKEIDKTLIFIVDKIHKIKFTLLTKF